MRDASPPGGSLEDAQEVTLIGRVTRLHCEPKESGWAAFRVESEEYGVFDAAGIVLELQEGATVRLTGTWGQWQGRPQLNVLIGHPDVARTRDGICAWLQTIKGIGPRLSERIYDQLAAEAGREGERVWELLRRAPERILSIKGIRVEVGDDIVEKLRQHAALADLQSWMMSVGLSSVFCRRALAMFGDQARRVIEENPYALIKLRGIGFEKADEIAQRLQIQPDSPFRLRAGLLYFLEQEATTRGHCFIPGRELIDACAEKLSTAEVVVDAEMLDEAIDALVENREAVIEDRVVYLRSLYEAECEVAESIRYLLGQRLRAGVQRGLREAYATKTGLTLHESQLEAIDAALQHPVTIITGGPGTGKTTLTRALVEVLEERKKRVTLCAPTGRAAKRLQEATGRTAFTIHRLLGVRDDDEDPGNSLDADMVLVDESSMVDIRLMKSLCRRLPPSCQLILVGDVDQLPSVGPGRVLADLIQSGVVPVVRLTKIQRQAEGSQIIAAAHAVNQGEMPPTTPTDALKMGSIALWPVEDAAQIGPVIVRILEGLAEPFALDQIGILSPQRNGEGGVHRLNEILQDAYNPQGRPLKDAHGIRFGDRVLHVRNNYKLDVFNGDLGFTWEPSREQKAEDPPIRTVVEYDNRWVPYPDEVLDELTLAYCTTVHKAQGSEFPVCIMVCHSSHSYSLSRRLLYTAITRGKQLVILVGNDKGLRRALYNTSSGERRTKLGERLRALV